MTGNPASASVLALAGCLTCLGLPSAAGTAHAQQAYPSGATPVESTRPGTLRQFDFDIPAQPLDVALDRYAAASQRPVLFPSELVVGRVSAPVRGRYLPEVALNLLLQNTGLTAEKGHSGPADAFVLSQADASAFAAAPYAGIDALVRDTRFPGMVQARIWRALCDNARTAPGAYRGLLRFRLDTDGRMQDVRLLASTGNARRDIAVVETLRSVQVGPPPSDMVQQPLTMLIVPGDQPGMPRCDKGTG
jgi:TonB family protein